LISYRHRSRIIDLKGLAFWGTDHREFALLCQANFSRMILWRELAGWI
jgi:hypothetical protein